MAYTKSIPATNITLTKGEGRHPGITVSMTLVVTDDEVSPSEVINQDFSAYIKSYAEGKTQSQLATEAFTKIKKDMQVAFDKYAAEKALRANPLLETGRTEILTALDIS